MILGNKVKIIQIMGMPNDACWQGHILGLGDDGVVYVDDHVNGVAVWLEYIPMVIKQD